MVLRTGWWTTLTSVHLPALSNGVWVRHGLQCPVTAAALLTSRADLTLARDAATGVRRGVGGGGRGSDSAEGVDLPSSA